MFGVILHKNIPLLRDITVHFKVMIKSGATGKEDGRMQEKRAQDREIRKY